MTERPALRRAQRALRHAAQALDGQVHVEWEGRILAAEQGVLRIGGLGEVGSEELVGNERGLRALVLGFDRDGVDAIVLHGEEEVREGARLRALRHPAEIPAGERLLGRVVDPLGRPLDGGATPELTSLVRLERTAPSIADRAEVHTPLHTGVLAIDAMFPIGRGQRELIMGDEGTGKTSLAVAAMTCQSDVVSVYVAIARRRSEILSVVERLRQAGVRFVVVAAPQDSPPGLRYLAPYAGCAIAEWFMDRGGHALVVYDDLSAHAVAWREISLLLRRPPGREAYPGDVFYLHSRLLERATQLRAERGGGSLTALPIAMTEEERLSAYIPTNLISITDGQIVLSRRLWSAGQKPAIDAGLSVSRVGGRAQPQALRDLAGRMRLDYAAFLELEAFTQLGTRLEEETRRRVELGRRIRALLRAGRDEIQDPFAEVVRLVLSATPELLRTLPEDDLPARVTDLCARCRADLPEVATAVNAQAVLSSEHRARIERWLREHGPPAGRPEPAVDV